MELSAIQKLIDARTGSVSTKEAMHANIQRALEANNASTMRARGKLPLAVANDNGAALQNLQNSGKGNDELNIRRAIAGMKESSLEIVSELKLLRRAVSSYVKKTVVIPKSLAKGRETVKSMRAALFDRKYKEQERAKTQPSPVSSQSGDGFGVADAIGGAAAAWTAKSAIKGGASVLARGASSIGKLAIGAVARHPAVATALAATAAMTGAVMYGGKVADDIQKESYAPRKEGETKLVDRLSALTRFLGGKAADKKQEMEDEKKRVEEIAKKARERDEQRERDANDAALRLSQVYTKSVGDAAVSALDTIRDKTKETQEAIKSSMEEIDELDENGKPTGRKKKVKKRLAALPKKPLTATQMEQFIRDHGDKFGLDGGAPASSAGGAASGGTSGGESGSAPAMGEGGAKNAPPPSWAGTLSPANKEAAAPPPSWAGALSPTNGKEKEASAPQSPMYDFGKNIKRSEDHDWSKDQNQFPSIKGVKSSEALQTEKPADKQDAAKSTAGANTETSKSPFGNLSRATDAKPADVSDAKPANNPATAQTSIPPLPPANNKPVGDGAPMPPRRPEFSQDATPTPASRPSGLTERHEAAQSANSILFGKEPAKIIIPQTDATRQMPGAQAIPDFSKFTPNQNTNINQPPPAWAGALRTESPSQYPTFTQDRNYGQAATFSVAPVVPSLSSTPDSIAATPQVPPPEPLSVNSNNSDQAASEGPDIGQIPTTTRDKGLKAAQATDHL